MKINLPILIVFSVLLLFFQGSCKKEKTSPYYFSCKINGGKWVPMKYKSLISNDQVLAAYAYYDPNSQWLQLGASRAVSTPSQPEGYMEGGMTINIINFDGAKSYDLVNYPWSGSGLYFWLYFTWAHMEIRYSVPMPHPGGYSASTTDNHTGICTITLLDTINRVIEGEFHFDALHRDYDAVVNVTNGKFRLRYEIKEIGTP